MSKSSQLFGKSKHESSKTSTQKQQIQIGPLITQKTVHEENSGDLQYINAHINPILSKMMIRIINQNPQDIVAFMIKYLEEEENALKNNQFKDNLSKTISASKTPSKAIEELRQSKFNLRKINSKEDNMEVD